MTAWMLAHGMLAGYLIGLSLGALAGFNLGMIVGFHRMKRRVLSLIDQRIEMVRERMIP